MDLKTLIDKAVQTVGSERKLGTALGVSAGNVNDWHHGRRSCPDKYVLAMARIAGLPPMATAMEVYKARLGELAKTLAIGVVAMLLCFGASDHALAAAGHGEPMRDDV